MSPEVTSAPEKKAAASFIGLKAYSEEQANIFFGRDEEIKTLYKLIKANTITIVFGKSGTGKTSLLNAGVFPKLREVYCLPFRIRLEFAEKSPPLLTQIKHVLKNEIEKYGFHVESYPQTETLWEYFHKEPLWKIITPVLIFDQFEEIFTLANKSSRFKNEELDVLIEELSDLVENLIPEKLKTGFINGNEELNFNYDKQRAKIIFAFREDYLAEIETVAVKIPSAKYSRFRLKPMNGKQAYEVITKTWKKTIDPSEANKIVYFLTNETETENVEVENKYGKYDIIDVEPSLLSQVCSFIERERIKEGSAKISADFLKHHPKDQILRSLYNEALHESNAAIVSKADKKGVTGNVLKEFIEDHLITDEGYRTKYALKEIDEKIKPGTELLEKKYLLRQEGATIELTHDVIVTLVKSDREERRKKVALKKEKEKAKKIMRVIVLLVFLAVAAGGGITYYRITGKANKDKDEAIAKTQKANDDTKKIEGKNALLRADSVNLTKFINKHTSAKVNGINDGDDKNFGPETEKRLRDSVILLNNSMYSLNDNFNQNYRIYKDSLQTLYTLAGNRRRDINSLHDTINALTIEKNNLKIENDRLRNLPSGSSRASDSRDKGNQMRINLLEKQIGLLQRNRDSLAAIIARNTFKKKIFIDEQANDDAKNKIFGYGYDYHQLKSGKKN